MSTEALPPGMYDDLQTVPHTVDAAGFVLVAGVRVPNDWQGAPLRACDHYLATCDVCCDRTVVRPLRLVCEQERVVPGGVRYFHAPAPGAFYSPRLCTRCTAAARPVGP